MFQRFFDKLFSKKGPTNSPSQNTKMRDPFCSDPLNARLRILLTRKSSLTKREFREECEKLFKEILKN